MPVAPSSPALEPGAVAGTAPTKPLPLQPVPGAAPWGALEGTIAVNFTAVQTVLLPAGTVLRRVFGFPDAADPWPSWETGSWWTRQALPATEAAWRAAFAVETAWNGGQCVVEWTTPQDIHAWIGPAAPQSGEYANGKTAPNCYLPGGGEQIYIAPAALPIGTWKPGSTPWAGSAATSTTATANAKPPSATAAPSAPAAPTPASLGASVGNLANVLNGMANEEKALGINSAALQYQVQLLKKYQARLQEFGTPQFLAHQQALARRLSGLTRHINTHRPWTRSAPAATAALHQVVHQASGLLPLT